MSASRLRVVTFNICGARPPVARKGLAGPAALLRELSPHVAGLQEVFRWLPAGGLDQPGRLGKLLGLHPAFRPSIGAAGLGYGNALLSRTPPLLVRRHSLGGRGERRSLLEARYLVDGRVVRVLNTHLGLREPDRRRQAESLAERVLETDLPTLLMGDWNAGPVSPEVRCLQAAGLFHCVPPETPTFPSLAPRHRIDYLFASRHFRVREGRVVESAASDHLPLAADLLLER